MMRRIAFYGVILFHITLPAQEYIPGEFVIKLKDGYTFSSWIQNNNGESRLGQAAPVTPQGEVLLIKRPKVEIQSFSLLSLESHPAIEKVEPNYIYRAIAKPNDLLFNQTWGLSNFGQKDSSGRIGVSGTDINIEAAWEITTDSHLLVAVIDTGIDWNHPDLTDNIYKNLKELEGEPGIDDDGNGYVDDIYGMNFAKAENPTPNGLDDQGHGSHCAGVIGAKGNNQIGITGVNWNIKMLPVKFLGADGSGSLAGAIAAIDYAVNQGAQVLSNSWGGNMNSEILKEAVQRSHERGVLFIAASGNDFSNNDTRPTFPASFEVPNIISVAAINNQGKLANFSNYGRKRVHVAAPGDYILSTVTKNQYASWSGTSMAAPFVSGVAALVWSQNPHLTHLEMKERLLSTVTPLPSLKRKVASNGLINAKGALLNELPPLDPEDPVNWNWLPYELSTPHPYPANANLEYEVYNSEATKRIAIYFEKFNTENRFDVVSIYDFQGNLIQTISGEQDGSFSEIIPGNYAKIVFKSDASAERYGFDITKIAYE